MIVEERLKELGIICEYCKSHERHGFKVIVLLPSHGRNYNIYKNIRIKFKNIKPKSLRSELHL